MSLLRALDFTYTEKVAVVWNMQVMIHADNKVTNGEASYLQDLFDRLAITNQHVDEAEAIDNDLVVRITSKMSLTKRLAIGLALSQMAGSDYKLDREEIKHLDNVMLVLGLGDLVPTNKYVPKRSNVPAPSVN